MRCSTIALCLGLIIATLPAHGFAQSKPSDPKTDPALVSAAVKEGSVVVLTPTDAKNSNPLVADFESLYPGVKVSIIHATSADVYNRFVAQEAAGSHVTDILWSDGMDLQMKLVGSGYAMTYNSPEKGGLPAWANYKDQAYATTLSPQVIVYNKRLLNNATLPVTHDGFLKFLNAHAAELKSKVTTYDIQASGVGYQLAAADIREWKNYWSLVKTQGQISAQYYQSGALMVEMVASGQYAIGYNLPYAYAAIRQKTDPNVGIALTSGDYVLEASRIAFIAKSAPHPNAAKLFLNYLISERGQKIIDNAAALGAVRENIPGDTVSADLQKQLGIKPLPIPLDMEVVKLLDPAQRMPILNEWKSLARS